MYACARVHWAFTPPSPFPSSFQVCRTTLVGLEATRAEAADARVHAPATPLDLAALTRLAVTCSLDDPTAAALAGRPGADGEGLCAADELPDPTGGVFGAASLLDPTVQALAAVHADLVVLSFRLELRLANELSAAVGAIVVPLCL